MATGHLGTLIRQLCRAAGPASAAGLGDAQLLDRFVQARDEAAFEVLLWRHGPMVLGLCRRLLRRDADVEDAFQATFLTLVRKAGAISRRAALGSWLYKVAYRVALRARCRCARQARRERPLGEVAASEPAHPLVWQDLRSVLDEEVHRLPERYRAPFLLCHLQGKTHEEAARELGCPLGTVSYRLSWARARLRSRLTRRGVAFSAGLGATLLAAGAAPALVPAPLARATIQAALLGAPAQAAAAGVVSANAAALTEGVLHAMWMTKVKAVSAVVLALAVLGTGGGMLTYRTVAAERAVAERAAAERAAAERAAAQRPPSGGPGTPAAPPRDDRVKELQRLKAEDDKVLVDHLQKTVADYKDRLEASQKETLALKERVALLEAALERTQAQADKAADFKAWAGQRGSPEQRTLPAQIEQARDEVELLEAQRAVKRAQLEAAKLGMEPARARLAEVRALVGAARVDQVTLIQAQAALAESEAQIRVKEAELLEPEVRLKQARRRLAGLEKLAAPAPAPTDPGQRLQALEKKLDALRQEVEALRRLLRPQKPGERRPGEP
jgi:RNA polymerase sigma factor (sigma-70 family)